MAFTAIVALAIMPFTIKAQESNGALPPGGSINSGGDPKSNILNALLSGRIGSSADGTLKEVDIEMDTRKGMDDKGVFEPAGFEVKEKFVHEQKTLDAGSAAGTGPIYPYGLGNVLYQGCYGSNYKPGDPCYRFRSANPYVCKELLDGVNFMGVGFDSTETYRAESRRKGLLQKTCKEKRHFHGRNVTDNLVAQGIYEYKVLTTSFSSARQYQQELASRAGIALTSSTFSKEMNSVNAGVSGGFGGFGGGLSAEYQKGNEHSQSEGSLDEKESRTGSTQRTSTFLAVFEADLLLFEIFQDAVKPEDLRWEFVSEFLSLPESYFVPGAVGRFQDFILRWGTHYVKYAKFGGQMKVIKTKQATTDESFSTFKQRSEHDFQRMMGTMSSVQIQAEVKTPWVSVSAGYGNEQENRENEGRETSDEKEQLSKSYQEEAYGSTTFEIEGGNPSIASAIFDAFSPSFKTDFKNWVESIIDYAKPFDFKLGDITELLNFNVQSLFGKDCEVCKLNADAECEVVTGNQTVQYSCSEIEKCQESLSKKRLTLQRAIEIYEKEGPIPVYDLNIPGGEPNCQMNGLEELGHIAAVPTWHEIVNDSTLVRIVFDLKEDIENVIRKDGIVQVRLFHEKWFVLENGHLRLYNGFRKPNGSQKINIQGLVMSYDSVSGLFDVSEEDYGQSNAVKNDDHYSWLIGATVARAEYVDMFKVAKRKGKMAVFTSMPCMYRWSNTYQFDPRSEGRCIRFSASSAGDVFVILAAVTSDTDTWYHIEINSHGVALYKGLKLVETETSVEARGQGSAILYQSYFVCVAVETKRTIILYGTAQPGEDIGHDVWLRYTDIRENIGVRYYTFGAGERQVSVMDISLLSLSFLDFVCRGELSSGGGQTATACDRHCHSQCDPFYSCTETDDPKACGKCKTFTVEHYGGVMECVETCPAGYQEIPEPTRRLCAYEGTCPQGFSHVPHLYACYNLVTSLRLRDQAESWCKNNSAELISIRSKEELNWVMEQIKIEEVVAVVDGCSRGQILCNRTQKCIQSDAICDSVNDCGDDEDELNCPGLRRCPVGKVFCNSADKCILTGWICDGDSDCDNNEDEINCRNGVRRCPEGKVLCNETVKCISPNFICDRDDDCGDYEDESHCGQDHHVARWTCPPGLTRCNITWRDALLLRFRGEVNEARCINSTNVCDGINDCGDMEDEVNCKETETYWTSGMKQGEEWVWGNGDRLDDSQLNYVKEGESSGNCLIISGTGYLPGQCEGPRHAFICSMTDFAGGQEV